MPARAGIDPNDRVAEVHQRELVAATPQEKAKAMRDEAWHRYIANEIDEKTWKRKNAEADKIAAPSKAEVLTVMDQRAHEAGKPVDHEKQFNGWSNWDTWETMLLLENTQESDRWLHSWNKNFNRKIKAGRFKPEESEKVVSKYMIPVARGKGMANRMGRNFMGDPDINPDKVNKAEIVEHIISYDE